MISSNFVGCSMARSADFVPLRILSTYAAERPTKSVMFTPYETRPPASTPSRTANIVGSRRFSASSLNLDRFIKNVVRQQPEAHPPAVSLHGSERAVEVLRASHFYVLKLDAQRSGRRF